MYFIGCIAFKQTYKINCKNLYYYYYIIQVLPASSYFIKRIHSKIVSSPAHQGIISDAGDYGYTYTLGAFDVKCQMAFHHYKDNMNV